MPEYIRVTDLSKVYRKHEAVKHISFQVGKGQIFAFLGPNGAGKSTTINILSTLLLKSSGSVCIGGMDLDRQRKQVKREIGIVFQDDVLDGSLSVYQNLLYRGGLYIPKEKELKKRISELSSIDAGADSPPEIPGVFRRPKAPRTNRAGVAAGTRPADLG